MDETTATIWVKVGGKKKNAVVIGGIYWQHKILGIDSDDPSRQELLRLQEVRWKKIVKHWKKAGEENKYVIIRDLNLNYKLII